MNSFSLMENEVLIIFHVRECLWFTERSGQNEKSNESVYVDLYFKWNFDSCTIFIGVVFIVL